jgi:hypothetical protein
MAQRRKTKAERNQLQIEAEERAWKQFEPKLKALQSIEEAANLLSQEPRPDSPGRQYYSNLKFFLDTCSRPNNASSEENGIYIELLRKFHAAGKLSAESLKKAEESFGI